MNDQSKQGILDEVASYYSGKLAEFGKKPRGVDWNSEQSQFLRFEQLARIIESESAFSVNDLGCGYGALYDYLARQGQAFDYTGIDVSEDMVEAASSRYRQVGNARFLVSGEPAGMADYGIASGIFNVRQTRDDETWRAYIETTLDALDKTSRLGFSFNCLTRYSEAEKMRDYLYYADPCTLFDHCKRRYSVDVALLHDYGLYEFTILVRKRP